MKTTHHEKTDYRFNAQADACLEELYKPFGATKTFQKIKVLETALGGDFNFQALGGEVSEEMKLGCLETDYLERMGKIEMILA